MSPRDAAPLVSAGLLLLLCGVAAGCGDEGSGEGGSGRPFEEARSELKRVVERTAAAALPGVEGRPEGGPESVPCRSAGGSGPARGEFLPIYALVYELPDDTRPADVRRLVERMESYYRKHGYRRVAIDGKETGLLAVSAEDRGRRLSFDADSNTRTSRLGASGPCIRPGPEEKVGR